MKKDLRPYYIKKTWLNLQNLYVRHFLKPHFDSLGINPFIVKPWHVKIFGGPINIGNNVTILACSDKTTRLTVWPYKNDINIKGISIGDHVLISPGVRISASNNISIDNSCMIASNVYLTDSDWHGIYDRSMPSKKKSFVKLEENVWIGDSAIICKGVTIGKNSIIGAGSIVTYSIPSNVIAAGNPAKIIRELDPNKTITTRMDRFSDVHNITKAFEEAEKETLAHNTLIGWIKSIIKPLK